MTKISDYNPRAAGIAWIREEDYTACLAIFEDGDTFFPSWKQWNESAEKTEAELKGQGHIVERVYIDPDTFTGWCRANGSMLADKAAHILPLILSLKNTAEIKADSSIIKMGPSGCLP